MHNRVVRREIKGIIYCVAEEVPELERRVNCFNVHIFYEKVSKRIDHLPNNTQFDLDNNGIFGGSFWVGFIVNIYN